MSFRQDSENPTEIIIGIIGPIGCNRQLVIELIGKLSAHHHYRIEKIGMSDVISEHATIRDAKGDHFMRVMGLMDAGNELRKRTKDNSILSKLVVEKIAKKRLTQKDARVIYIVDSIKHPDEVEELRNIYGKGFYLIAVHSPEKARDEFLESDCMISDSEKRKQLIERDKDESLGHGQSTREAFQFADFFLSENGNIKKTKNWLKRFLDLVFGDPFGTPTFNEYAMFMAYSASTRSANLSRQVGAVVTVGTDMVSGGANECPQAFGGTYWPTYESVTGKVVDFPRGRDYTRGEDRNSREKSEIINALRVGLPSEVLNQLNENIKRSGLEDITEFGRVVHAEMDAILSCARRGQSCAGAALYCTTYPCHNCAKHILASGIREVIFVEPYPKSKAMDMHDEAIAPFERSEAGKVVFKPFVGVGPRQFVNFFSMSLSSGAKLRRKAKPGFEKAVWERGKSIPRMKMVKTTYIDHEDLVYQEAMERLGKIEKVIIA